jgi:hypothetical protein
MTGSAKQSMASSEVWIASSQVLLAMTVSNTLLRDEMRAGIHPDHLAGHVARARRGEEAHQLGDIFRG